MAEVYSDKTGHRSGMNWILIVLLAVVALAIIVALVR
jgi:hypothetical protein